MIVNPTISKRFECQRCERRFVRREHLSRHERSHTKEKPFSCMLCSQAFTRRDLLVRHNRLYHASPVESDQNNHSPGSHTSMHSKESQCLPDGSFVNKQEPVSSHSGSTTSPPQQQQQYEQLPPPFAMPPNPTPIDLGPPPPDNWGRTPDQSTVNVANSGIMMDTPIVDPWMSTSGDYEEDFSSFLDNIPLSSNQYSDFFNFQQPLPFALADNLLSMPEATPRLPEPEILETLPPPTNSNHDSLTQFGSRLPSLQPEDRNPAAATPLPPPPRKTQTLTNISVEARAAVAAKLESFANVVPRSFTLVSRHALSRYITGFIAGFHEHLPFLHIPTTSVETISIELTLALAAIGAQYCREPEKGLEIFRVAKALCIERIRRRDQRKNVRTPSLVNSDTSGITPGAYGENSLSTPGDVDMAMIDTVDDPDDKPIETAQALLVLMAMATWFKWRPPAREAPAIRSLLETLMRDEGLKTSPIPDDISWDEWVVYEGQKRTKFIVFCFFNLHSIIFDIPPMILNGKIDMALPCTEAEWRAPDERTWREARRNRKGDEPMFLQAFAGLFQEQNESVERRRFSSLGSYILIHALIQHIWLTQALLRSHIPSYSSLSAPMSITPGTSTPSGQSQINLLPPICAQLTSPPSKALSKPGNYTGTTTLNRPYPPSHRTVHCHSTPPLSSASPTSASTSTPDPSAHSAPATQHRSQHPSTSLPQSRAPTASPEPPFTVPTPSPSPSSWASTPLQRTPAYSGQSSTLSAP